MSTTTPIPHFTEPTTQYWQAILPASSNPSDAPTTTYQFKYPAVLPDSRILYLPIRQIQSKSSEAVASLILNQASLRVVYELGTFLAEVIRPFNIDVVIGLPTLGLSAAAVVAEKLGHERYVPLGYSRKFWYQDALSTAVSSITSPTGEKPLYLDPNQLPLVKGKRCVLIDDAVSSGKTLKSSWEFLEGEEVGAIIEVVGVCMKQGERWRGVLDEGRHGEGRSEKVKWVFESPLLKAVDGGWVLRD